MTLIYNNGIGQSLGDIFVTGKPLYTQSTVYYVSSLTGSDSNTGLYYDAPYATLAAAFAANEAQNVVFVLLDGHTETFTASLAVASAGTTIIGAGSSGGIPTVSLTMNSATLPLFNVTAAGFTLGNVKIKTNAQANTGATLQTNAASTWIRGCYFECTSKDTYPVKFLTGASQGRIESTTFVNTGTTSATGATAGVYVSASMSDLVMDGVVFDGGSLGSYIAYQEAAAVTRLAGTSCSFIRGSKAVINSATVGYLVGLTTTGDAGVQW